MTGELNRRILVIDDNRWIHTIFRAILSDKKPANDAADDESRPFDRALQQSSVPVYQVDSAYQGDEGLAKVIEALGSGQPYAMAFVDMRMPPGWGGMETIARLWREDPHLEIVVCTAFSDFSRSDMSTQLGSESQLLILKKPFDVAEVAQLAASLTEKWNLARCLESRMNQMELSIADRTSKIEQAHRETESLLAAISSLLIGVDEHGVVRRWNTSAEELFGVSSSDAVGKPFSELRIEWADPKAAKQLFMSHKSGAIKRRALNLVRDDSIRVLGISTYPVTEAGQPRGYLCLGTDITNQHQLEQQLQQAHKLEAVGQLAAGVAHEINTPMQYVGDNLDFLQSKLKKLEPLLEHLENFLEVAEQASWEGELIVNMREDVKKLKVKSFMGQVTEAIGDSQEGVHHVSRIVRAMKEFAHPGQEEKTPVDINRALESTIAVSTNEWKYVAEIEKNFDASAPLVPALAGELNQAFLNILVNASHAISDANDGGQTGRGTITVSTRGTRDHVEVTIADSGTGIPDEIKQRIFDPFFTTKEVGKGTGQGLAIAHSVVVGKHGGTLRCDSSLGVGTTFSILLPIEPSENETHDELEPALFCE